MHKKKLYLLMSAIIFLTTTAKVPQPVYGETPSLKAKAHDFEKRRPELFDDGDMNKPIVEGNWIYYLSDKIDTLMSLGRPRKVSFDGDRTWEALSSYDAFLHSKFEKVGDYLYYSIVTDKRTGVV